MRKIKKYATVLMVMGVMLAIGQKPAGIKPMGNLKVVVKKYANTDGKTNVILFNDPSTFPLHPERSFRTIWTTIQKDQAEVVFDNIPYGEYAVVAYHDANNNHKLDLSWIGIPKEGTAVSNDARGFFMPRFKDAKVGLNSDNKTIVMNMGY